MGLAWESPELFKSTKTDRDYTVKSRIARRDLRVKSKRRAQAETRTHLSRACG